MSYRDRFQPSVSICAGADVLQQWAAMLTGFLAGIMYICARFIEINLKIDDPADVVPVHFASGLLGVLTRPLFGYPNGIIHDHSVASAKAFTYNLLGAVVIVCWCSVSSFLVFIALKTCKILRVSAEDEIQGLDSHYQAKVAVLDDSGCQMSRNEVYIITERL
ncbi:hypothetical protein J437_LFUL000431 [Ladona fulva]|uniref:Ammonium transporter AmtB-like domain-containing protein n=1 Tax=Ladona fulva TaxID=123851 RepID=A0A8K0NZG5_LADFU|nr:hypothetical protein J437_LFUL000431 [Ladona fulva]